MEFSYFAHVYGNWPELVLVPPPPSSGQRALLNTLKTGKKCHIVWDRPLMINRRGNQFNFISSRSLGYPTGFYFPPEEEISSGSLGFMISILPRPPATRQVPTARDKGESIGLYISTWTEFSRIKSDKHGWTTKKKTLFRLRYPRPRLLSLFKNLSVWSGTITFRHAIFLRYTITAFF